MKYKDASYNLGVLLSVQKYHWDKHEDDTRDFQNVARCPNCRAILNGYFLLFKSTSTYREVALFLFHPVKTLMLYTMVIGHHKAKRLYPEHYAPEKGPKGTENA